VTNAEPRFDAVWPLGRAATQQRPAQTRLDQLDNKTIALIWDFVFRGDEMFELLKTELAARYQGLRFIDYQTFGNVHGGDEREVVAALPQLLSKHKADAAIVGVAA
jgi:hypothetical protein